MPELSLDSKATALVLIDLQQGILSRPLQPHAAADVVQRSVELAQRIRASGGLVVLVHVMFGGPGGAMFPTGHIDEAMQRPPAPGPDFFAFALQLGPEPTDLIIAKRQWGAFHGTELDSQLRRRGIKTLVLGGVATNFGVESTARVAWEHNYDLVLVEDAMTTFSSEAHAFAIKAIFPRLGRVRSTAEVLKSLDV